MSACSDQQDFTEKSKKDPFGASANLYQLLATRLHNLANSIKAFLEFVSNCILYLLGFNHQMFEYPGSGDNSRKLLRNDDARLQRRPQDDSSHPDCLDISEHSDGIGDTEIVCNESKEELLGGSIYEDNSSDSDTECCFAVKQLRKLVWRQTKRKDQIRRRALAPNQETENAELQQQKDLNTGDGDNDTTIPSNMQNNYSQKSPANIPQTDIRLKGQDLPSKCTPYACSTEKGLPLATGSLVRTDAHDENTQRDMNSTTRSPRTIFTKTTSPIARSPKKTLSASPKIPSSAPSRLPIFISDCCPISVPFRRKTASGSSGMDFVSSQDRTKSENEKYYDLAEVTHVFKHDSDNILLFNKIVGEVSSKPLDKSEETIIRDLLNLKSGAKELSRMESAKRSRLEHVRRLYCITAQALRQKVKHRDEIFDDAIHRCRRSIKIYIDNFNRNEDSDTETLYFKQMILFYKRFKECADERKLDIGRFIKKAKNEEECEFLINNDKEIATAVRRLKLSESEEQLMSISWMFQDNSESAPDQNFSMKPKLEDECLSTQHHEREQDTKPNSRADTKAEVTDYLTKLCYECQRENKSFQESLDYLADHFANYIFMENLDLTDRHRLPVTIPAEGNARLNVHTEVSKPQSNISSKPFETCMPHAAKDLSQPCTKTESMTRGCGKFNTIQVTETKNVTDPGIHRQRLGSESGQMRRNYGADEMSQPEHKLSDQISERRGFPKNIGFGSENNYKELTLIEPQQTELLRTSSKRNVIQTEGAIEHPNKHTEEMKRTKLDEMEIKSEESRPKQEGRKKKQPPPVPKKPVRPHGGFIGAHSQSRLHKTLQDQPHRQAPPVPSKPLPPPVPKKPDLNTRRAALQNRTQQKESRIELDSAFLHTNNENNSFMQEQPIVHVLDDDGWSSGQRILQDVTSSPDHHQEIVFDDSAAYEVVQNKFGGKTFVPNILDFEFHQNSTQTDEVISDATATLNTTQGHDVSRADHTTPERRMRLSVDNADEKYEEHFIIDNTVLDQSGCKIMPGSGQKVNKKKLEQKTRMKKRKTKGVANKHLLKAFNDTDQNQAFCWQSDENDDDLHYLDEFEEAVDSDADSDDENKNSHKDGEAAAECEPVKATTDVQYVEDIRHWQMLPTEVHRKHDDDDEIDDKYNIPSKGARDEKKKGRKRKEKKQKAQPLSLLELNFQYN